MRLVHIRATDDRDVGRLMRELAGLLAQTFAPRRPDRTGGGFADRSPDAAHRDRDVPSRERLRRRADRGRWQGIHDGTTSQALALGRNSTKSLRGRACAYAEPERRRWAPQPTA